MPAKQFGFGPGGVARLDPLGIMGPFARRPRPHLLEIQPFKLGLKFGLAVVTAGAMQRKRRQLSLSLSICQSKQGLSSWAFGLL
ncbi:MAG TPA: hypothetical protein DDW52_09840 [Planctomycetaceae bacterium]|nr:hypothetical protein [Planctomycetaceae bacterium]